MRIEPADLPYVVAEHQQRLGEVEVRTADLNVLRRDMRQLTDALKDTREELVNLKRVALGLIITILGGAVMLLLSGARPL